VKKLVEWLARLPERPRTIFKTCAYGFAAGLVAVAFQLAMNGCYRAGIVRLSHTSHSVFLWSSLALILGTSLVSGWLLNSFCAEAAGSGIPQLKAAFWKNFGCVPFRVLWVKFIAATLQIGGGSSLGREGPSVQLAGTTGSLLAGVAGEAKQKRRVGAATGAAAGLAAAFNTPLAGVTFVLEELIGDLNSRLLGSVLLGAMLGALVAHGILGPQPSFSLAAIGEPAWRSYLLVPLVAAAGTLVGVAFQKTALGLRARQRKWHGIPAWLRPALGGFICWALGVLVFFQTGKLGVFGLGYDDLSEALTGKLIWQTAVLLLAAKFVATVACYGMGGCGGIFSPTLFFGAMTGLGIAHHRQHERDAGRGGPGTGDEHIDCVRDDPPIFTRAAADARGVDQPGHQPPAGAAQFLRRAAGTGWAHCGTLRPAARSTGMAEATRLAAGQSQTRHRRFTRNKAYSKPVAELSLHPVPRGHRRTDSWPADAGRSRSRPP